MKTEEAIKILERAENYVGIHYINGVEDPYINPCLLKAIDYALVALRAQQTRQKQQIWHKWPEEKPTEEKDYCVIQQYHSQGTPDDATCIKDGEIWVEMDYWHNTPDAWYGWESIGKDNPWWETLYWIDLGRTEISLPKDMDGKVTRMFGETVMKEETEYWNYLLHGMEEPK